ncbi:MAG: hypothetical protein K1X48_09205 [Burkholderiaceae bacterium]|nr:hypothetical protein [Burkholderiaceae bacterium]
MTANLPVPEFQLGQTVRVVPHVNGHTEKIGVIRDIIWHYKDARYYFYIKVGKQKISTRYIANELEIHKP